MRRATAGESVASASSMAATSTTWWAASPAVLLRAAQECEFALHQDRVCGLHISLDPGAMTLHAIGKQYEQIHAGIDNAGISWLDCFRSSLEKCGVLFEQRGAGAQSLVLHRAPLRATYQCGLASAKRGALDDEQEVRDGDADGGGGVGQQRRQARQQAAQQRVRQRVGHQARQAAQHRDAHRGAGRVEGQAPCRTQLFSLSRPAAVAV